MTDCYYYLIIAIIIINIIIINIIIIIIINIIIIIIIIIIIVIIIIIILPSLFRLNMGKCSVQTYFCRYCHPVAHSRLDTPSDIHQ